MQISLVSSALLFSPSFVVISEFEHSKRGLLNLTESFDVEVEVSKAGNLIQEVISKGTLAIPDDSSVNVKKNTSFFTNWLCEWMFGAFQKEIGIREETLKFWPGRDESKVLLKKIERAAPGLTKFKDPKSNSFVDREICEALFRRFDYERKKHRDAVIVASKKGIIFVSSASNFIRNCFLLA